MNNKLLSCPFCDGEAVVSSREFQVYCNSCGARTTMMFSTDEEAIKAWNTRSGEVYDPT